MEFLSSLSLVQWIFVLIGLGILGSSLLPWLKDKFEDWKINVKTDENEPNTIDYKNHDLTNLVCKWECLVDACEYMDLQTATEKLYEVFPLLIEVRTDDSDKEEEF